MKKPTDIRVIFDLVGLHWAADFAAWDLDAVCREVRIRTDRPLKSLDLIRHDNSSGYILAGGRSIGSWRVVEGVQHYE